MHVSPYEDVHSAEWDQLVSQSVNGTFLHSRRFIGYHKNRFDDESLLIRDASGKLVGALPAARSPNDPLLVISHPGLTYGGLVRAHELYGGRVLDALESCAQWYRDAGFRKFQYKPVPAIYHRIPAEDDIYALFRIGARAWRTDLCAAIDCRQRGPMSRNRRTGIKRAASSGVEISRDPAHMEALWAILERQLEERHGVRPVHTWDEICMLRDLFPAHVSCMTGLSKGRVIAGLVLFHTPSVTRAQYSAADPEAREISALDLVFETAISESVDRGIRYFDFGNSNEDNGSVLNEGLYRYKVGLGAGGVAQQFYEMAL